MKRSETGRRAAFRRPRARLRSLLWRLPAGLVGLYGGAAIAQQGGGEPAAEAFPRASDQSIVIVVPPALAARTERVTRGCWIKFFNDENFQGAQYNYIGPTNVRDLWNFVARVGSISVGPNAQVILYADPAFRDLAISLGPGQRVADLPEHTRDVHVTFGSMKIRCTRRSSDGSRKHVSLIG